MQVSRKTAEGKNIGRANETTPTDQAIAEARSMWEHKESRKYSTSKAEAEIPLALPMLAHSFTTTGGKATSHAKRFEWPGFVQPKLDGVRCLAERQENGIVRLTSRQGREWHIPHIAEQLATWLPEGTILDGEIWIPGVSCQRLTSWAKSACPDKSKSFKPEARDLLYYVYDVPMAMGDDTMLQIERFECLESVHGTGHVLTVETYEVSSEEEMWGHYGEFMQAGYEGAILRGPQGQYLWGYRSAHLLKVKRFQDAEFEVVGARDGKGKMEGCVVWICRNDLTDGEFECTMKVPMDERRRMYTERDQFIGSKLTVRFFDRTDDQKPRFPVGIVFRADEDLP